MSQINVNTIRNRTGGPPNLDKGAVVTGILTCTGDVTVGGTLTYEDVTNIDSTGIVTAKSGINVGNPVSPGIGATIDPNGNAIFAGIVTATSFSGTLSEGNTEVETIDTGSDGHVKMTTEGSERVRVGPAGQLGLSGANYGDAGQVLTSSGNASAVSWTSISSAPEHTGIASGSITGGRGVCVADDGKLLPISGYLGLRGTQTPIGEQNNYFDIVYSTAADKFVIFYRDEGNGNVGKAKVGTQGTGANKGTITWGAAVQFTSASALQIRALYDSTNDKVVVSYKDSATCSIVVGSLSGSTLTFGTPVQNVTGSESGGGGHMEYNSFCYCPTTDNYALVYNSSSGNKGWCRIGKYSGTNSSSWPNASVQFLNGQARETGCWYDTTANKLIVAFNDGSDSNHGHVIAGTVSGDNVTFGTKQEYDGTAADLVPDGCHDSDTGKNIIVYPGDSYHGYAKALTLSGTTFTFGSAYKFCLDSTSHPKIAYDSAGSKKFLITYSPYRSSQQWGESIVATLTGDVITYDTKYQFSDDNGAASTKPSLGYSPDSQSFVAVYRGTDHSPAGAEYFVENIRVSNVTAGNYVGIANASYTNGQTASVAIPGAVNVVVSGLTVGQKYYVLADGTLSTTADVANILAGNSVAPTKLLVR